VAVAVAVTSVIVLNYNGREWLERCLDAVAAQRSAPPFETIVVDNGSTDGSAGLVHARYPGVVLIETGRNVGFAAGNNAGARAARGTWLAFLNNDTEAAPDWLERMHAAAAAHPHCALVTSRIVFMDAPQTLDSAGDGYLRAGGGFKRGHGMPAIEFEQSQEVFGACGAAFLIRRSVFDELEGFDESFFAVYEDVDLSYRARLRGHGCWYAADAVVRHAGSATLGVRSPMAVFHGQRNLEWTWIRNTPWPAILTSAPAHVAYSLAGLAHYAWSGLAGPAVRGKIAALQGLPAALRARRRIQAERRISDRQLAPLMDRGWLGLKRREKRLSGR
jgi:N-acetylglucosaminyl-diphospho-decaprenol L-rhamnosyltransferase